MVQAAARGLIEFSPNVPHTKHWWKKLYWMLGELERQHAGVTLQASMQCALSIAANPRVDATKFSEAYETAFQYIGRLRKLSMPWIKEQTKEDQATEVVGLWTDMYGDPDDPETKAMIAKALKNLKG